MNWTFPPEPQISPDLLAWAENDLLARLLVQRGITTVKAARAFINPDNYESAPPDDLPDMARAVEHLNEAIKHQTLICVWGDFDVDGQTSTALLFSVLQNLGANVCYYIPHRLTEGHGIKLNRLKKFLSGKLPGSSGTSGKIEAAVGLLLTCDTGIEAHDAVQLVHDAGAKIIITDHHDLPETLPPAEAVINPKRLPPNHPLRELPGVGVAYKLAEALATRSRGAGGQGGRGDNAILLPLSPAPLPPYPSAPPPLDLVALGIVADVATQTGDTRYLLQRGLETLRRTERPGLLALIEMSNLKQTQLTAEHIGFWLGPRLNALGRLGNANQGVELLTTKDKGRARILAAQLDALNERRKLLVDQTVVQALSQLADTPSLAEYNAIVLAAESWHPGVIGIACSRLVEQFNRPVILLTERDGLLRGSARSVTGCDIHQAIKTQAHLLDSFGGHPMAAGLSFHPRHLSEFRQGLSIALAECVARVKKTLTIDATVILPELTLELLDTLQKLAPFGSGNPPITLAVKDLTVQRSTVFGRARTHCKVTVGDKVGNTSQVVWWNSANKALPGGKFDLALRLSRDTYRTQKGVQLVWVDAREKAPKEAPLKRQIIDLRRQSDTSARLTQSASLQFLVKDPEAVFWASESLPGVKRLALTDPGVARYKKLVLWQAPPGSDILQQITAAVQPEIIYLVARPSRLDTLPAFMEHLMGVIKYALKRYGGRLEIAAIAAAMGHRAGTIRLGLVWLVNQGKLRVIVETEEVLVVRADNQSPRAGSNELQSALLELLRETAAYRAFMRTAQVEALRLQI